MGRYKKRKDGRYVTTVMIGYKADGRANNVFLSAKTEKELRDFIKSVDTFYLFAGKGHSDIKMIMEMYAHLDEEKKRSGAGKT